MTINVDAVRASNPLDRTVEQLTGQQIVKHKIYAPWRQEDTPSVHIYEDSWYDYGSGRHGDVIAFVGYYKFGSMYDPNTHFKDVVSTLGYDVEAAPPTKREPVEKPKLETTIEQIRDWHDMMPDGRRAYWHSRGLNDRAIDHFLLGWDGKRYIIPGLYKNEPFGIKRRKADDVDDGLECKYIQITGSRVGIFNADTLWKATSVVICEGEIDAMLLEQHGYRAVTTTGGAGTWKDEWAKFFAHIKQVVILYDNDKAGVDGAAKVISTITHAKIVTLPPGIKDVGELVMDATCDDWLFKNIRG